MLPFAFQKPRHPQQEELLGMVSSQLKSMESGLMTELGEKQQKVSTSTDDRAALEAEIAAAAADLDTASTDLSSMEEKLQIAEQSLSEFNSAFTEAENKHNEVVVRIGAAEGTKMQLELAISSKAELDVPDAPDRPAKIASFKTQIESLVQDQSLRNAVLLSQAKQPTERGSFDTMVLHQLETELQKLLEKAEGDIASGGDQQAESKDALAAAEAALESAKTVHEDAASSHKEAVARKKGAASASAAAAKKLRDFDKELKQWTADVVSAEESLKEFQNGPLVAFEELSVDAVPEEHASEKGEEEAEAGEETAADAAEADAAEPMETTGQELTSSPNAPATEDTNSTMDATAQVDNAAPMKVDSPVASDKIVTVEPANSVALGLQAGA